MSSNKGNGRGIQLIRQYAGYTGDDCVIWPMCTVRGYGYFGYNGRPHLSVHRFVCELTHGPAPSDTHEAAHDFWTSNSFNPNHIKWKTPAENIQDCRRHGTHIRHRYGNLGKITPAQADEIRALKGTQGAKKVGAIYGVSQFAIADIWAGRTHSGLRKLPPRWTAEDNANLEAAVNRGLTHKEIAAELGRSHKSVAAQASRLSLKSKWVCTWQKSA